MEGLEFTEPTLIDGHSSDGEIQTELPVKELRERILDGEVFVLKDVWDPDGLRELRRAVTSWGDTNPTQEDLYVPYAEESFHRYDYNPTDTPYRAMLHAYCFYDAIKKDVPDDNAHELIQPYISGLHSLHTNLTDIETDLQFYPNAAHYHPQIYHYPSGGGYFGVHRHVFEPNKIGVIGAMSKQGTEYESGGTRFLRDNETIDITQYHDIGDIALFRYDLVHSVLPVDPSKPLDWDPESGRWSLLMPYHGRVWEGDL